MLAYFLLLVLLVIVLPHAAMLVLSILAIPTLIAEREAISSIASLAMTSWSAFILWVLARPLCELSRDLLSEVRNAIKALRR